MNPLFVEANKSRIAAALVVMGGLNVAWSLVALALGVPWGWALGVMVYGILMTLLGASTI